MLKYGDVAVEWMLWICNLVWEEGKVLKEEKSHYCVCVEHHYFPAKLNHEVVFRDCCKMTDLKCVASQLGEPLDLITFNHETPSS